MLLLLFPTHAVVGYLLGVYSRFPVAPLVVGSVLPDLVDRPLFWLGVTPVPHSVGHSLFVALPVGVALALVFGPRGVALALGWLGHILTDMLNVLTTQGPAVAPYYGLYPLSRPEATESFNTVTVVTPVIETGHTVHPVVLGLELLVIGWGVAVVARNWWRD